MDEYLDRLDRALGRAVEDLLVEVAGFLTRTHGKRIIVVNDGSEGTSGIGMRSEDGDILIIRRIDIGFDGDIYFDFYDNDRAQLCGIAATLANLCVDIIIDEEQTAIVEHDVQDLVRLLNKYQTTSLGSSIDHWAIPVRDLLRHAPRVTFLDSQAGRAVYNLAVELARIDEGPDLSSG